jgi:hypothetical protein
MRAFDLTVLKGEWVGQIDDAKKPLDGRGANGRITGDQDYSYYLARRHSSICSDDSLDLHHRHIRAVVGLKHRDMHTFAIEQPVTLSISGRWTPMQVWREYKAKAQPKLDGDAPPKGCLVYLKGRDDFDDPRVAPFLHKPLYDWENWHDCDSPMPDGSRIVFVV